MGGQFVGVCFPEQRQEFVVLLRDDFANLEFFRFLIFEGAIDIMERECEDFEGSIAVFGVSEESGEGSCGQGGDCWL